MSSGEGLLDLARQGFTHLIDLVKPPGGPRIRPTAELESALPYVGKDRGVMDITVRFETPVVSSAGTRNLVPSKFPLDLVPSGERHGHDGHDAEVEVQLPGSSLPNISCLWITVAASSSANDRILQTTFSVGEVAAVTFPALPRDSPRTSDPVSRDWFTSTRLRHAAGAGADRELAK